MVHPDFPDNGGWKPERIDQEVMARIDIPSAGIHPYVATARLADD
jgi:hypothetical protein